MLESHYLADLRVENHVSAETQLMRIKMRSSIGSAVLRLNAKSPHFYNQEVARGAAEHRRGEREQCKFEELPPDHPDCCVLPMCEQILARGHEYLTFGPSADQASGFCRETGTRILRLVIADFEPQYLSLIHI